MLLARYVVFLGCLFRDMAKRDDGCGYGKVTAQRVDDLCDRIGSRIEDAQGSARSAVQLVREYKDEMSKIRLIATEANNCAEDAFAAVREVKADLNKAIDILQQSFNILLDKVDKMWIPMIVSNLVTVLSIIGAMAGLLKLLHKW